MTPAGSDIQEHLTVNTASGNIHTMSLPADVVDELELSEFQLIHDTSRQRHGMNITRRCKYSQLFLIMGENIARNM